MLVQHEVQNSNPMDTFGCFVGAPQRPKEPESKVQRDCSSQQINPFVDRGGLSEDRRYGGTTGPEHDAGGGHSVSRRDGRRRDRDDKDGRDVLMGRGGSGDGKYGDHR